MPDSQTETKLPIGYQDVLAAAEAIGDTLAPTPAARSRTLSTITGADIYLKFEIFQFTASFKERGALNRLLALTDAERARGVVAMSAGNHAQGVAYHAARLSIPATIVMPHGTPFTKVKRTEELGAHVVLAGDSLVGATEAARQLEADEGLTFIHPFDDALVMAGQGTVGKEFLETFPELDVLVVPIGGGGLISGIAVAAKAIKPDIHIIGVQTEAFPSMKAALQGQTIEPSHHTLAEGIAVKMPGELTQRVVQELVEDILVVSESRIEDAINLLMEVEKVVVEGAGAAGLAAVLQYPERFAGLKAGLVLCGANIDPRTVASCIMRGLARDGRITRLRVTMLDLPGGLHRVSGVIAQEGGNIIEVQHLRQFSEIPLKYTELELVIETKDRHHTNAVIKGLENAQFAVRVLNSSQTD